MKSLIISFVAALAIGTGGATSIAMQRGKAAAALKAQADSVKADSIKAADSTHVAERVINDPRDSTAHRDSAVVHVDSLKALAAPAAAPAKEPVTVAIVPAAKVPAAVPAVLPVVKQQGAPLPAAAPPKGDTVPTLSEKRIAKAFASMPPKDAAKVFEVMSDADVSAILASLSDKESAAILAKLPPQRVASIINRAGHSHGSAK